MADMKFEFVVEGMTREQADELGNMIIQAVESIGLICGGNVHGMELKAESCPICGDEYCIHLNNEGGYDND